MENERSIAGELAVAAGLLRHSTVHVRNGRMGAGSGVLWNTDGLVVTNAHVARGSAAEVELWDGRTFHAEVTARDERRDLASLAIEASDLPAAQIADSDSLRVGQLVVALGNPLGMSGAATLGIIHAIAPAEGRGRQPWVQADVHLAPGNSGGPLADAAGRVIGINSMVSGGLGLAVPSNDVQRFLRAGGATPYVGIVTQPVALPVSGGVAPGLLVLQVTPSSPAEEAGLLLGDVITGAGGHRFRDPREITALLRSAGVGDALTLDILRGGAPREVTVLLGGAPRQEAA